jgi:hypothetical protein
MLFCENRKTDRVTFESSFWFLQFACVRELTFV